LWNDGKKVGICEQPPEICVGCVLPQQRRAATLLCEKPCVVKAMSDGWQPRWPGDMGDPFEPYTVSARNCTGIHLLISRFMQNVLEFEELSITTL
jgi:hypothetical protein